MPVKKAIKAKAKGAARKRRERASIPELILDGAEELFARAGYAGTTTRAIARRARINVGQLHYYFDSKRALFEAVVARHGAQITDARRRLLREAEAKWPRGNIPVEVLVEALVRSLPPRSRRRPDPIVIPLRPCETPAERVYFATGAARPARRNGTISWIAVSMSAGSHAPWEIVSSRPGCRSVQTYAPIMK